MISSLAQLFAKASTLQHIWRIRLHELVISAYKQEKCTMQSQLFCWSKTEVTEQHFNQSEVLVLLWQNNKTQKVSEMSLFSTVKAFPEWNHFSEPWNVFSWVIHLHLEWIFVARACEGLQKSTRGANGSRMKKHFTRGTMISRGNLLQVENGTLFNSNGNYEIFWVFFHVGKMISRLYLATAFFLHCFLH